MSKIKVNFKMPPESVAQKLYRRQQELRKKSGLPDPEEYKKRMQQYDKELGTMKKESVYVDELPDTGGDSRNTKSVVSDVDPQKKKRMDAALATANKTSELPGIAQKIKEAVWGRDKMSNLQAAHDRHAEKAIAANRAGDDQAVKVHQSKMGMIKTQMNKLRKEETELGEAVHRIGLTVTDPDHPMVSKRKETIQKTVRVTSDSKDNAIKSAIAHHKRKGYKVHDHHYIGTVNEAKDAREYDYEGDMAKSQLRSIIANAQQVHDMLQDDTNMAEWVQSKITLAADYISTVADYMQSEVKEEVAQVDELRTSTMLRYATKANKALIGGDRNKEEKRIKGIQKANYKIQTRHSVKEDAELDEAIKLGSKVVIHAPGKSYHGKTGQVGEIRHGAFKGAAKTYTIDHDGGSIQLDKKNVKLQSEEVQIDELALKPEHRAAIRRLRPSGEHSKTMLKHDSGKQIHVTREGDKVHLVTHEIGAGTGKKTTVDYKNFDEAWSQNGRNPQRGVKVGDKVRSYDFPGMHDDHYIEGHVVADNPHTYHIRVNKVVRSGKEIPVPAHMQHVEAPKGKSNFSNAYAVHKMMAKQQSVTAAPEPTTGAQKTFNQLRGKR